MHWLLKRLWLVCQQSVRLGPATSVVPMPFGSSAGRDGVEARGLVGFADSFVIVDVEDERLKVLASGARWVSFNSVVGSVKQAGKARFKNTDSWSISKTW